MIRDPLAYFLGLSASAEPHELLGLEAEETSAVKIETALRQRLAKLYQHRDGNLPEADSVRRRLRLAAKYLRTWPPRKPWPVWLREYASRAAASRPKEPVDLFQEERAAALMPPLSPLTPFDQHVMAVLVGCGGWNAVSRGRLVALSAAYGVSVEGLLKVIAGLGKYARTGGPRLGLAQITAGASRVRRLPPAPPTPLHASVVVLQRLAPEFGKPDVSSTIKLSVLFAVGTLLAGVLFVRLLVSAPGPRPPIDYGAVTGTIDAAGGGAAGLPRTSGGQIDRRLVRAASFSDRPTFLGNGVPAAAADAADECPLLAQTLQLVARKLTLTDEPAESVFRDWDYAIGTIAVGWVLTDASTRQAIDNAIAEALIAAADTPSISDRLLAGFAPATGRMTESLDLWRGAWKAGTLARIARSNRLPPVVVERARLLLETTLGGRPLTGVPDYGKAGAAWLDLAVPELVGVLEYGDRVYDDWELWLAAHRELGDRRVPDESLMNAIESILSTNTDLSHHGPSINVLGRLLGLADYESSPVIRQRLLRFFDTGETISSHDLWVVTSLLATYDWTPWFNDRLILPDDADRLFRRRMRDLIDRQWPETADQNRVALTGGGLAVDEGLVARWLAMFDQITEPSPASEEENLMRQLLAVSRLNEAAAQMAAQKSSRATDQLNLLESQGATSDGPGLPDGSSYSSAGGSTRPGQALGTDGVWAGEYQNLRRNTEAKLRWLRTLRSGAGTDLGPIDAAVFVREVYHGAPEEVRSVAQAIASEQFGAGPNVVMELLDQFPDAPRNHAISEMIRLLAGRVLPEPRSEAWQIQARLALVDHVLILTGGGPEVIDELVEALIETLISRAAAVAGREDRISIPTTPQVAARTLLDAWRQRAALVVTFSPVPGDMSLLARQDATRLRLARGPIQEYVATQLAVLDLLTYVVVAEQPAARTTALRILREEAEKRRLCPHVLEQALQGERAIATIWRVRLAPPDQVAGVGAAVGGAGEVGP